MTQRPHAIGLVLALALTTARPAIAAFGAPTRVATVPAFAGPDTSHFFASTRTATGTLLAAGFLESSPIGVYGTLRSTDGGASWTPIPDLAGWPAWLLVSGPGTVDALSASGSTLWHRRSTDDGLTFDGPMAIPTGTSLWFWTAAVAPDGVMAAIWNNAGQIQVTTSPDALNWSPIQDLGAGDEPGLAWDPVGHLLVCWGEATGGSPATGFHIVCRTSPDRGGTFDPPVEVYSRVASGIEFGYSRVLATSRGAGSFLLVYGDFADSIFAITSSDAGRTWTTPVAVPGSLTTSLETRASWTWLVSESVDQLSAFVTTTVDGSSFTVTRTPRDSVACTESWGRIPHAHPGVAGEVVLVAQGGSWRSDDGGLAWTLGELAGPRQSPAQDARAVRLPSGRWVALWSDGQGGQAPLRASVSDDDGASFSPPTIASDRPRLASIELLGDVSSSTYEEHRSFDAIVTSAGDALAAWVAADENGCETLRVSRSPDGVSWAPSTVLGSLDPSSNLEQRQIVLPFSLIDDGTGRLALVWTDPTGAIVCARSVDGGSNWTAAQAVSPALTFVPATEVARTASGALVFLAMDVGSGTGDVASARSVDGGASWTVTPAGNAGDDLWDGVLLAAGPRLVAGLHVDCSRPAEPCEWTWARESTDDGQTWQDIAASSITAEGLRAGDAAGNVYHAEWVVAEQHLLRTPASGPDVDLGALPASGVLHDVIVPAPGDVRLLWADGSRSQPPGVFFAGAAAAGLLRDDSIGALLPRPDIAALFPLAPYAATAFPGMTDADTLVVDDGSRPLVLYALGGNTASTLLVAKRAGLLRLDW